MGPLTNIYVFAFTLWNNIHLSVENEFIANYSSSLLTNVPENIPVHTHVLDLSHNRISGLNISEFISLSDLQIFLLIWYSPVEHLTVRNLTFRGPLGELNEYDFLPLLSSAEQLFSLGGSMKTLTLEHVRNKLYYFNQETLYRQFSEMNIASLTIYDAYMPHMLCPNRTSSFQYLNFSRNALTDELFQNCGTLTDLKLLILQRNKFESLPKVSFMTSRMKSLKYLDMSSNLLRHEGAHVQCQWAESLTELDLSSNQLTDAVFECLPVNIEKLNLQINQINSVPKGMAELKALKELNLASNHLADLPGCGGFTSLEFLNVEVNLILTPSADFFQSCPRVRELQAGQNPFKCSCELRDFIRGERQSGGRLFGWPAAYVCEYPEDLRGTQLKDFHLSELACNTVLLLVTALLLTLVLVAVVAFLCIYLDVPWYVRMTWQWTQTKRRAWHNHPEEQETVLQFHAFISYSERDALWVKDELIPNLEKGEGCVQLCQHERNFIPGKSIVENIINCIEKSYKSIFVLSPNFVQSEWCHYELYFAHHKLFSENSNSLILILLEPIPPCIIPARYHKLKALMAKRTYLEWPKERSKRALFWANLRAAININLPISSETDEEQSDVTSTSSISQYANN
ncbi:toll-like receptor 6 isoform X2 [Strigops habroptila]|uniref:toll-like receptor 6 isoform X2 n=1 Tax=Strigops habroptila TaxID=2489341 RepID=UPI0011CFA6FE|nr:toll-like receptor 6 isoform X2 [Strigops habroptila]